MEIVEDCKKEQQKLRRDGGIPNVFLDPNPILTNILL